MPDDVAFGLHRSCGYLPKLVAFDVKLQSEPDLVLPAYRRVEEQKDVEFRFYRAEATEIVAEGRRSGLDGQELADAVEGELHRLSMSAREAEDRSRRGQPVAHSVLMIFGERRGLNDLSGAGKADAEFEPVTSGVPGHHDPRRHSTPADETPIVDVMTRRPS